MSIKRLLTAIARWVFWIWFGCGLYRLVLLFLNYWNILEQEHRRELYRNLGVYEFTDEICSDSYIGTFFCISVYSILGGTIIFLMVRTFFLEAKTQFAYNKLFKKYERSKGLEARFIKNWRNVQDICSNKFDAQIISCGPSMTNQSKLSSRFSYLGQLSRMIDNCSLAIKLYRNKDNHADIEFDREKAENEMNVFESDSTKSELLFSKSELKNRETFLKENGYTFCRVLCKSLKSYFTGK